MALEDEFTELVAQYKGYVYTVCYMFAKSREDAGDLYQEVLANLWKGYGSFRGQSKLSTWIYRVALNTCISVQRHDRRRPAMVPLTTEADCAEEKDLHTAQLARLYARINRLGQFDKAIVLLWFDNLSYEEIGEVVGISAGNVSVRLVRIKEQLKKMSND